jgi:HTH-type transcriptional regulator/antitoxin HigA
MAGKLITKNRREKSKRRQLQFGQSPRVGRKESLNMVTKRKFALKMKQRDSYLGLVLDFPLASIQSDEHRAEAQKAMDRLLAKGQLDEGSEIYLDALSDLVATFEDEHYSIVPPSDADMLRHFLEAKEVTQAQLSRESGIAKGTISEILSGRKPFSRKVIRKLATYFGVDVSILSANL